MSAYFTEFGSRFVTSPASDANGIALQAGAWKFDYDKMSMDEIREHFSTKDGRPRYCAETFPGFKDFRILELGPSDGYNTAGLESQGAREITSIDGNAGAFLRCLILKNAFQLKAKFLLGDFIAYMNEPDAQFDLVYASGVLYHLLDPVDFIKRSSEIAPHLFLWTFYHDEDVISGHEYEKHWFKPEENQVKEWNGHSFTYHKRYYETLLVEDTKYAGGLTRHSYWLSRDDLFAALELAGYRILKVVPDAYGTIPALNILASKK